MDLLSRIKNILLAPATEWQVIAGEKETIRSLLIYYVLPLQLVPMLTSIARMFIYGSGEVDMRVPLGILITGISSFLIATLAVQWISDSFKSNKDLGRSAQLVAYSWTANTLCSVFTLLPAYGRELSFIGFFYMLYTIYLGLGPIKDTPPGKKILYVLFIIVTYLLIGIALGSLLGLVMIVGTM